MESPVDLELDVRGAHRSQNAHTHHPDGRGVVFHLSNPQEGWLRSFGWVVRLSERGPSEVRTKG